MPYLKYLSQELHSRKKAPSFFREEGVKKIDIDFGYFIERSAEQKILHAIFKYRQHLLTGRPASGKTSLARKIGYLLEKQGNFHVVMLDAGDISASTINDVLTEINDAKQSFMDSLFIIVDDVHCSFESANDVLLYILDQDISALFCSRPSYRYYMDVKKTNVLIELERRGDAYLTELTGAEIEDALLTRVAKSFANFPSKEQIDELKKLSAGDLWVFGRLLNVYDDSAIFDLSNLYYKIKGDVELLEKKHNCSLAACIGELAYYGKYEIPVQKSYFAEKFSSTSIESLINEYIIYQKTEYLYFYHSTIASLYEKAVNVGDPDYSTERSTSNSISSYLCHCFNDAPTIFSRLGIYFDISESVLSDPNVIAALAQYMRAEDVSLYEIADLITDICRQGTPMTATYITMALESILVEVIHKIKTNTSIMDIGYFLNSIPWIVNQTSTQEVRKNSEVISKMVIDHRDEQCVYQLSVSQAARNVTNQVAAQDMIGCSRYIDRSGAFYCRKSGMCSPSDYNIELVRSIDLDALRLKIVKSNDIFRSAIALHLIYWADPVVAKKLFEGIDFSHTMEGVGDKEKFNYIRDVIKLFG